MYRAAAMVATIVDLRTPAEREQFFDPQDPKMNIRGGPIGKRFAKAMLRTVTSPDYPKPFQITFDGCYPVNEEACLAIREVMRRNVDRLCVQDLESSSRTGSRMIKAIFGQPDDVTVGQIRSLKIASCNLDDESMNRIKSWVASASLEEICIEGDCDFGGCASHLRFVSWVYEGSHVTPGAVSIEWSDMDNFDQLKEWKYLCSVHIEIVESTRIHGLGSLKSLQKISFGLHFAFSGKISLGGSGLCGMLRSKDCPLRDMAMPLGSIGRDCFAAVMEALKQNTSLEVLDVSGSTLDEAKLDALLDFLGHPLRIRTLRTRLAYFTSLQQRLPHILESLNPHLSTVVDGAIKKAPRGSEYHLARNWAGRQLLLESNVPLGLWPIVLGRLRGAFGFLWCCPGGEDLLQRKRHNAFAKSDPFARKIMDDVDKESPLLRADSMYHMLRQGQFLFVSNAAARSQDDEPNASRMSSKRARIAA